MSSVVFMDRLYRFLYKLPMALADMVQAHGFPALIRRV